MTHRKLSISAGKVAWAAMLSAGSLLRPAPALALHNCAGISLSQALIELGQQSGITLAFNAARVPQRCVSRPDMRDPMKSLAKLAAQAHMRLIPLRGSLYALVPTSRSLTPQSHGNPLAVGTGSDANGAALSDDAIVVMAQRSDDEAAAMLSRLSTAPTDIVSADAVRRLPAISVADALRQVPGLQFDNQRGVQVYLFARGLDSSFHMAMLDGRTVAINDLIENGTPMGRSFRFEMLPPEVIDTIAVTKTNVAGDIDPTIGVTADVRTPRPFMIGRQFTVTTQQTWSETRGKVTGAFSSLGSWVNPDRSFGVLGLLTRRAIDLRNDRFLEFEWTKDRWPGLFPVGTYTPGRVRPTIELEDRRQTSAFGALQWQPAPGHQIEATALLTRLDVRYDEYGLDIYPDDATYNTPTFVPGTAKFSGTSVVAGTIDNVRWMGSHETSLNRHDLIATGLKYTGAADGWQWSANLGWSLAHSYHPEREGTSRERIAFFAPLTFDFSGGYKSIAKLATNADLLAPSTYQGWIYNYAPKDSRDTDASARLDVSHTLSSTITAIRGGFALERRTRRYWRRDFFIESLVGLPLAALGSGAITALPITDAFASAAGSIPTAWLVPRAGAFRDALLTETLLSQPLTADDLASNYEISETARTGYAAADLASTIAGLTTSATVAVRVSQTVQRSSGYEVLSGAATPVSYRRRYLVALPSAAVKLDFNPNWALRIAAARSFTRPNLTDIAPRFTTSLENRTASGGNPELRPFTGTNLDIGLSYAGPNRISATLTVFARFLDNYLTSQNRPVEVPPYGTLIEATTVNGEAAVISGAELAWSLPIDLPRMVGGRLTLDGSGTINRVRSRFDAGDRLIRNELVGLSHLSLSARARIDWRRLSLNCGYFWRSRYLNTYGSSIIGEEYVAPLGTLDAQLGWMGPQSLFVSLGATNITGVKKYLYGLNTGQPKEINIFGRRLVLSLTWKLNH